MIRKLAAGMVVACLVYGIAHAQAEKGVRIVPDKQVQTERARRWAVLIGVDKYEDELGIGSLKYCGNDMKLLYKVLTGSGGGFHRDNVLLMTCDARRRVCRPTRSNVVSMVPNWLRDAKPEDDVLFAFSGHGIEKNGKGYLLTADSYRQNPALTALPLSLVRDWLGNCRARRKMLIVDACHAGAGKDAPAMSSALWDELKSGEGFAKLASCGPDEKSNEDAALQSDVGRGHGVFTYYLAEGLRGGADRDGNGRVDVNEAYLYAYAGTRRWARFNNVSQTPLRQRSGIGMMTVSYVTGTTLPPPYVPKPGLPPPSVGGVEGLLVALGTGSRPGELRLAVKRLERGESEAALAAFGRLAKGDDAVAAAAMWGMVKAHVAANRMAEARDVLDRLDAYHPGSPWLEQARGVSAQDAARRRANYDRLLAKARHAYQRARGGTNQYLWQAVMKHAGSALATGCADTDEAARLMREAQPHVLPKGFVSAETRRVTVGTPQGDQDKQITYYKNSIGMEFVKIPAGEFMMGSPSNEEGRDDDEGPQHRVRITKPFYVGVTEVTQAQYQAVMGKNPSHFKGAKNPVEKVSWSDCVEFCNRLSRKTGQSVRLPTEAEWEYACRAGTTGRFYFGDNDSGLGEYAWYTNNSGSKTHPVGGKKPNAFGLYDMHGNVWEWCADWYDSGYYEQSPTDDPQGLRGGKTRVLRGGSWSDGPRLCRSARRFGYSPTGTHDSIGFRVVALAVQEFN